MCSTSTKYCHGSSPEPGTFITKHEITITRAKGEILLCDISRRLSSSVDPPADKHNSVLTYAASLWEPFLFKINVSLSSYRALMSHMDCGTAQSCSEPIHANDRGVIILYMIYLPPFGNLSFPFIAYISEQMKLGLRRENIFLFLKPRPSGFSFLFIGVLFWKHSILQYC